MITILKTKTTKGMIIIVSAMTLLLSLASCQDFLDVQPEDKLVGEQVYRNVNDADAAVLGIYGKFMGLAKKYVVLNEMRADLMTTTANSDPYLKQLSEHNETVDNPYVSPRDFYEVILNCNDALKNFDIMLAEKRFTQEQYNHRYSDIGCIRSWVYLQLGIQYGSVPYITEPIENIDDVKNISQYPRISFDQLIVKLVDFTENLPFKKPYPSGTNLRTSVDGYSTEYFFINKECLLGDLNLWKGDYLMAASYYKKVLETATGAASSAYLYDKYRLSWSAADLMVTYTRTQDATSLLNTETSGWRSIFSRPYDAQWTYEWIWSLPFDSDFAPANPFISFFSKSSGDYQAKPSQTAIDKWNSETQANGIPYDARGSKYTYKMVGNDPVIMKYLFKYEAAADPFKTEGDWFLYRAAKLVLRYAEAANRDNEHRVADGIYNRGGIRGAFTKAGLNTGTADVTNEMQTHKPFPYDFKCREGQYPYYRDDWYRASLGVRGRANLIKKEVVGDSLISIENNLIDEAALELAYEGNRWEDLVRIARRRNDPSFLADKIYDKLSKEGNAEAANVKAKLLNPNNWYLPFNW